MDGDWVLALPPPELAPVPPLLPDPLLLPVPWSPSSPKVLPEEEVALPLQPATTDQAASTVRVARAAIDALGVRMRTFVLLARAPRVPRI
jgi:hypothetical protein